MRKLSIDKEKDVKYFLEVGKPYTGLARGYGVSKDLQDWDVARRVRQGALGAIESAQKASKIIETTLDRPVSRATVSRAVHSSGFNAKKKLI
jgi:hypothetical protein